jgi:hypothetical protein
VAEGTQIERTHSEESAAQRGVTEGAHRGVQIEMSTPEINPYLYQNLVSNVESQIEHWNRKAARQADPDAANILRTKAEGLGYALRLLAAFEPEFRQLTDAAIRFGAGRA